MNECHAGLRDLKSREWDRILFWLRSTKETVIHSKPLSVYIQQKTVETYSAYWQRFTCFCLRAIEDPYPPVTARLTGQTEINVWGRGAVSHHEKRFDR
jgi:hypothetical protein